MTVILNDPFTTLANWAAGGTLVAGRTGNGMDVAGGSLATYTIPAGPLRTNGQTISFSWKTTGIGTINRNICQVRGSAAFPLLSVHATIGGGIRFLLDGVGGAAIAASADGLLVGGTWYTIELAHHIADSGGAVRAKLNGTTILNVTGVDTAVDSANTVVESIALIGPGGGAGSSVFDDFLATTDDPTAPAATMKVWNGTAWVTGNVKTWNGSAFVDATAVKTWSGSAWV